MKLITNRAVSIIQPICCGRTTVPGLTAPSENTIVKKTSEHDIVPSISKNTHLLNLRTEAPFDGDDNIVIPTRDWGEKHLSDLRALSSSKDIAKEVLSSLDEYDDIVIPTRDWGEKHLSDLRAMSYSKYFRKEVPSCLEADDYIYSYQRPVCKRIKLI